MHLNNSTIIGKRNFLDCYYKAALTSSRRKLRLVKERILQLNPVSQITLVKLKAVLLLRLGENNR
ncbi:hypothetical protein CTA1_12223 [Colletotrichum tanaceti]|uniref:Uncharacterized protein n=1 Tax=Colletotrichum tanaceti TaxID=1306861 RepID=A0A4V6Y9D3_9PEZI|nr:hypothetical protein CTA1_12223 [Colletotrichum tanaceti]